MLREFLINLELSTSDLTIRSRESMRKNLLQKKLKICQKEFDIKGNGIHENNAEKDKVHSSGLRVIGMMDFGKMIEPTDMEGSFIQTEITMRDNG